MHYHLVGNHDASNSSLTFNSVNCLSASNHVIISEPMMLPYNNICFLPYITECDRKPLKEYFPEIPDQPRIILSHNDISGIQLGPVMTKTGFSLEEIEANCSLFLNGHLHNGQALTEKVINLGNLTGKDFGENALQHSHNIAILDTKDLSLTYIENPYAYNFYKLQIDCESDTYCLDQLKNNAVVSAKCTQSLVEQVRQQIEKIPNIVESRVILIRQYEETSESMEEINLTVDHLTRFIECCKASIENSAILEEELSEICK
jgi:hypothetical protein